MCECMCVSVCERVHKYVRFTLHLVCNTFVSLHQLANTEEYIEGQLTGQLGDVLIR